MAKLLGFIKFFIIISFVFLKFNQVLTEESQNSTTTERETLSTNFTESTTSISDTLNTSQSLNLTNTPDSDSTTTKTTSNIDDIVDNRIHSSNITHPVTENPTHVEDITDNSIQAPNIDTHPVTENPIFIAEPQEPFHLLSAVHEPNAEESKINSISSNLLTVTKEILSTTPRTYRNASIQTRLRELRTLEHKDISELLAQRGIIIPQPHGVECDSNSQYYRNLDGSCNNFLYPCWGKADEPYLRWLQPVYANGIDEPRRRRDGHPLPNPRLVYQWISGQLEQNDSTTFESASNLVVVWGQMIAHEVLLTPTVTVKVWDGKEFKDEAPNCCEAQINHPDCIPIVMNYADSYYPQGHCMSVARSAAYVYSPYSCRPLKLGLPREQMNQVTSFIDASIVYGSSEKHMRKLRENKGQGARLLMDYYHGFSYPPRNNKPCKSIHSACDKRCFLTGEKRANENPILGAMHTLWVREHNRLVDALRVRGWPEETLFHVVRKIVGAVMQHITYKEYLPHVIGPRLANHMNITVPTNDFRYNPYLNPTLYNVFVTAAFRYGHSMLSTHYLRRGKSYTSSPYLSQDFFSMDDFCHPTEDTIASLIYAQADQTPQKVDCRFSKQVTNHLFAKEVNGMGFDLFSINVQRGRDHGLPPYNKWREACGLHKAYDYNDLKGVIPDYVLDRLSSVYGPGGVDEIDMFVGGISEFPVNGGILGPTFTCIVANQFKKLKFGDRFWYENTNHPGAFTTDQIDAIRKTTFASLICRNSDIKYLQPMAFKAESASNPKISCYDIIRKTDLDLNLWP